MITITIEKQDIYKNLMALTAVIGRNRQNMNDIAVLPDNLPAVEPFMNEAVTEAENELRRFLDKSTDITMTKDEAQVSLNMEEKKRFDTDALEQMKSSLLLYISHYMVSRWVSTVEAAKDLTEAYQTSAGGYIAKLKGLVCQKQPYVTDESDYKARLKDSAHNGTEKGNDGGLYARRQNDLQPIRREWPDGVIRSEDEAITKDQNNHILVSN